MRRIRLTTGPGVLFLSAFAAALIVFVPLRLVLGWIGLDKTGFSARAVSGSIWSGSLDEARFGELAVGDLNAHLAPLDLMIGHARVSLDSKGTSKTLHGAVVISRHSVALDRMSAALSAGTVFAPIPVKGIDMDDVTVRFQDNVCTRADGRVRATLAGEVGGIALTQGLSGVAKCESGALMLPLASQSGAETAAIRLWPTGRFHAEMTVRPTDPAAGARLVLSGFQQNAGGYTLAVEGSL